MFLGRMRQKQQKTRMETSAGTRWIIGGPGGSVKPGDMLDLSRLIALTCTTQLRALAIGEGKHTEKRPHRVRVRPWPDSALERVQLGEALLLFLLAGGFVAEVRLLLPGVGGIGSRCRAGLDVV